MSRRLAALLCLAAAAFVAGCGGEDEEEVGSLLDKAFDQPIKSAVVSADIEIEIEGVPQLKDPIRVKLTGPYRSGGEERIPAFDWDISLSGGGQAVTAGLVSTHDNVFVEFQGQPYEVGEEAIGAFNRQIAEVNRTQDERGLTRFGIDPRAWLLDEQEEGDEEVAGVETTHVSAKVDVGRMLDDLNKLIDRAGGSVPGATPPPKLTEEQQRQVEQVVKDPSFDVYVGKDDSVVRRFSANLRFDVPEGARERVGGIEGGRISFSVEFAKVGEAVTVKPRADARPIAELAEQLGGLGALGGGGGQQGQEQRPGGEAESGSGGGGGDAFQRYAQCLEDADPSDIAAIEACSELLQ